jgi:hypothetical protein
MIYGLVGVFVWLVLFVVAYAWEVMHFYKNTKDEE